MPDNDGTSIPKGSHWADVTEEGTILMIDQPRHQTNAVVGGMMASRMKIRGVVGCVVSGRVRDLSELKNSGLPVRDSLSESTIDLCLCSTLPVVECDRSHAISWQSEILNLDDFLLLQSALTYTHIPLLSSKG